MSFLAPWALAAGVVGALAIAALHLIAWRRPPSAPFPTARFVPDGEARAASWSRRPADLPLLALRVLALLLAAAAFARPVLRPSRRADVRVFVVDRSRAARDASAAHDSVAARFRAGDRVIAFDSAGVVADSSRAALAPVAARGSLSAGLAAALGTARSAAAGADRVTLVLVTALAREEADSATAPLAALWPGPVQTVALERASTDSARPRVTLAEATSADPLAVALSLAAPPVPAAAPARPVRVSRGDSLRVADLALARAGATLVWWPRLALDGTPEGAVSGTSAVVVAPLMRPSDVPPAGVAVARWLGGAPAAGERAVGSGCVREVRVPVPEAGDLVLSPSFVALVRELLAPCGGARDLRALAPDAIAPRVVTSALTAQQPRSSAAPWLLGAALALLLAEPLLRRGRRDADASANGATGDARDVGAAA